MIANRKAEMDRCGGDKLRPDDRLPDTLPRGKSSVDIAKAVLGQKQGGQ